MSSSRIENSRTVNAVLLVASALLIFSLVPAVAGAQTACERWVSTSGSDSAEGSAASPWRTMTHAAEAVPDSGCTVWFAPGVYRGANEVQRRFVTQVTFRSSQRYKAVMEHDSTVLDVDGAHKVAFEGFEFRHSGPTASGHVVIVDRDNGDNIWAEDIAFRDNIFHDSYDNDLLKIHAGVRRAVVSNNVFYNSGTSEQHMDVNSVTDVVIQDNVFFNDFAASGRPISTETKAYIVVKDSGGNNDGQIGAERIKIRRNLFLNWQGGREALIQIGNDGKPYHEADDVDVESNLFLLNSSVKVTAAVGIRGARDVSVVNNTVVGDEPASGFAYLLTTSGDNPDNENVVFANNIWSSPGGAMDKISTGDSGVTQGLRLTNNLYWNGGQPIPAGDAGGLADDEDPVVANPRLPAVDGVILPVWTGNSFVSGATSIRSEFVRLALRYTEPASNSPVIDRADPALASSIDVVGGRRDSSPDIGAREVGTQPSDPIDPTFPPDPPDPTDPPGGFVDIGDSVHADAIEAIAEAGITKGCNPPANDRYCPKDPVTRGQMAAFFRRAMDIRTASTDTFDDDDDSEFESDIDAIAGAGVTVGCDPPANRNYCPNDDVSRGQMAAFIVRALDLEPSRVDHFGDDDGSVFEADIDALAAAGITRGCDPPANSRFCTDQRVTREEMASFLFRAFLS